MESLRIENSEDSNDSLENEHKIDGELVLRDAMHRVCQYLNIKDLSVVTQVCKSWKKEASQEINKRDLELKIFHAIQDKVPPCHASTIINNKPEITLLFIGSGYARIELSNAGIINNDYGGNMNIEQTTIAAYRKHFPNKLIVIGAFDTSMNGKIIHTPVSGVPTDGHQVSVVPLVPCGTVSLSIPQNKHLNIKTSYHWQEFKITEGLTVITFDEMIERLLPDNAETKSTLLVFIENPYELLSYEDEEHPWKGLSPMLKTIESRFRGKSYTLWGFVTNKHIFVSTKFYKGFRISRQKQAEAVGLNLFGPNVDSWSLIINVSISTEQMNQKLNSFKESINLKRCSIGFLTAPIKSCESRIRCYEDHSKLVSHIEAVFPDVPFVGTFCNVGSTYFAINSAPEDGSVVISNEIISIMILSYK